MSGLSLCDLFATDVRGARLAGAPAEERVRETCEITPAEADEEAQRCYGRRFEDYGRWQGSLTGDDLARQYRPYRFEVAALKVLDEKRLGDAVFVHASVLRP